ncbi:hypothetical protein B0H16DRAFT_1472117 [Mycena metata]|uniref:Uncharacterized protein n=1 Tax=Mycena metata TaxID=1033252 RepID=A0AAD7HQ16_9AGAR|nr:hypothetical protein B0H16DRAFT_1472117 [Mycena metata]
MPLGCVNFKPALKEVKMYHIGLRALNAYAHPLEAALNTTMQADPKIDHGQRIRAVESLQAQWLKWHNELPAHAGKPPAEERTLVGNFLDSMLFSRPRRRRLGDDLRLHPSHPWSSKARMAGRAFSYAGSIAILASITDTIVPLTAVVSWTPLDFALASSLGRTRLAHDTGKRIEMHRRTANWDRNNDTAYKPEPLATKNPITGAMDWGLLNGGCASEELYSLALKVKNVIKLHKSGLLALEGEEAAFWLALGGDIYKPLCSNCRALADRNFGGKNFCDVGDEAMREFRSWRPKAGKR